MSKANWQLLMPTFVLQIRRQTIYPIAQKSIVILVCLSVAFAGGLRCALNPSEASINAKLSGPIQSETPVEETPVQRESNSSEEQPKEEEAVPSFIGYFSKHRQHKWTHDSVVEKHCSLRKHLSFKRLFFHAEYRLRNGCGANLRC